MKLENLKFNSIPVTVYCVSFEKNDDKLLSEIEDYAIQSANTTYKRSGMNDDDHIKNIVTGKKAEETFHFLMTKIKPNIKITDVSYAQGVDQFDFIINDKYKLDVKSSSLSTKSKKYTIEEAFIKLNFTVLKDQSYKDIIVQAFYSDRDNTNEFYFMTWAYVKDVITNNDSKYIKMNGNSGHYYLLKINSGKALNDI